MSLDAPAPAKIDGTPFSVGIVAARFNADLTDVLLQRTIAGLRAAGVQEKRIKVLRVPGSHEVPVAALWLAGDAANDVVIGLGVLIGGDTNHHEMVGQSVSHALQDVALGSGTPVINGVIVANTRAQAEARTTGVINRGNEFARAALEMADLRRGKEKS